MPYWLRRRFEARLATRPIFTCSSADTVFSYISLVDMHVYGYDEMMGAK
jgi:hypothetical protein